MPIEHSDISEFLDIGTEGNPIQELTHGVSVTNKWLQEMIDGDIEKRSIWAKVLQRRGEIGYHISFLKIMLIMVRQKSTKKIIIKLMLVICVQKLCYHQMISGLCMLFVITKCITL